MKKILIGVVTVAILFVVVVRLVGKLRQGSRGSIHVAFPAVSPDGRQILALTPGTMGSVAAMVMNTDGSNQRPSPVSQGADWMPDSRRVLAIADRTRSGGRLVTMNVDGSDVRDVPTGGMSVGVAQVAAKGQTVLFATLTRDEVKHVGHYEWYVAGIDGSNMRPLKFPVPATETVFHNVAASHDGQRVAIMAIDFTGPDNPNRVHKSILYVMNIDGTQLRALATFQEDSGALAWSLDDREIALAESFTPHPVPTNFVPDASVVVVDAASGQPRTLTHHDRRYLDEHPSWSPDSRIYFQSNRDGRMEIYWMKADGSAQTRVTR